MTFLEMCAAVTRIETRLQQIDDTANEICKQTGQYTTPLFAHMSATGEEKAKLDRLLVLLTADIDAYIESYLDSEPCSQEKDITFPTAVRAYRSRPTESWGKVKSVVIGDPTGEGKAIAVFDLTDEEKTFKNE